MSISSLTYDPAHRDQALHDLSLLHIRGDKLFKLDMVAAIYLNGVKQLNVYRRYSSVYEFLLEDNYHTIHFQRDVRVMDSLHHLVGALDDRRATIHAYSHKHHGAFIHADDFHFDTLRWSEFHGRWQGGSIYIETPREQWASPVSPAALADSVEDYACHEVYQEESESDVEASASPEASHPEVPETPATSASAHTPSTRRCLSDRFTALLQKRTFSEAESESEDEESQEDCCTVLRSGMKYPRNLY
jgi:hypothetical protein